MPFADAATVCLQRHRTPRLQTGRCCYSSLCLCVVCLSQGNLDTLMLSCSPIPGFRRMGHRRNAVRMFGSVALKFFGTYIPCCCCCCCSSCCCSCCCSSCCCICESIPVFSCCCCSADNLRKSLRDNDCCCAYVNAPT